MKSVLGLDAITSVKFELGGVVDKLTREEGINQKMDGLQGRKSAPVDSMMSLHE